MALIDDLTKRRDAIGAELRELTSSAAGGKPNNPGLTDHVGYKDGLYRELRQLKEEIAALQGPVEIVTYGIV